MLLRSDEGWESFAFKDSLKLDVPKWSFNVFITHVPSDPLPARCRRRQLATRCWALRRRPSAVPFSPCADGRRPLQRAPLQTRHANPAVHRRDRASRAAAAADLHYRLRGRTDERTGVVTTARADGGAPTKIRSALKAYLRSGRCCNQRAALWRCTVSGAGDRAAQSALGTAAAHTALHYTVCHSPTGEGTAARPRA